MTIKFVGFVLTVMCFSCNNHIEKTRPTVENITESVYASGVIKTKGQYQVFPVVSGTISKLFVTESDLVKPGSPLIQISDQTSKLNRENASLAAQFADLDVNRDKLTDLKNNILLAQSRYSTDSLGFTRQQNLWNQHIGSRWELEQKELAAQSSKTALEAARIRYDDLLKQLEFNAKQAKNNLAISKSKEGDYIIRSEINGKVYSLERERGELVNPQTPLATIGDDSSFLMDLQIDEYDIVKIKPGQKVLVSMDSYKGEVYEARISRIYPIMNERTRSFTAEAEFIRQPPVLYPNLTVEANIIIRSKERSLTIPRNYLVDDSLVLISKNKKKVVVTGLKDYQKVEIIRGLNANDVIYKPAE